MRILHIMHVMIHRNEAGNIFRILPFYGLPFELLDKIYSSLQSVGLKKWTFVSYQTHKMLQWVELVFLEL